MRLDDSLASIKEQLKNDGLLGAKSTFGETKKVDDNVVIKIGDKEYALNDHAMGAIQAVDMMIQSLVDFRNDIIGIKQEEILEDKTGSELLDGKV